MFQNQNRKLQGAIVRTKRFRVWEDLSTAQESDSDSGDDSNSTQEETSTEPKNVDGSTVSTTERRRIFCKQNAESHDDPIIPHNSDSSNETIDDGHDRNNFGRHPERGVQYGADDCGDEDSTTGVYSGSNTSSLCEPWASIFTRLQEYTFRPYLVHDTLRYGDHDQRDDLVEQFYKKDRTAAAFTNNKYDQPFYIIVDHDITGFGHFHILHDCKWSSRRCNCSRFTWYQRSNTYRRPSRISTMSSEDWHQIFSYLCTGPRRILQIRIGGHLWRSPPRYSCLSDEGNRTGRTEELVAILFNSWTDCRGELTYRQTDFTNIPSSTASDSRDPQHVRHKRKHPSQSHAFVETIIGVIKDSGCAPLERCFELDLWHSDTRFMMLRPTDRIVDTALTRARNQINQWKIIDFIEHYLQSVPLFYAENRLEYDETYMSLPQSIVRISELLLYQFKRSIHVKNFLNVCYKVCNHECGKHNSIFLLGESNAGKTQFADALVCFFLNRGMMRNPSRQERFSFQECAKRRMIFWDEAKLDPGHYDNIKRLLAGDNCTVAVKFKSDQTVYKTPIIICSNNSIFPSNDEFYNRLLSYRWFAYPLWRTDEVDKKFNPIAVGVLMCWAADNSKAKQLINFDNINKLFLQAKMYIRSKGF